MSDKPVDASLAAATRLQTIESLVPVMIGKVAEQLDDFVDRLGSALWRLSTQSVRTDEVTHCSDAAQYLKKNAAIFKQDLLANFTAMLQQDIATLGHTGSAVTDQRHDLTLVSLDEMEIKVLISSISQAIELRNSSALVAVNLRLGNLLQEPNFSPTHNPFRPASCVRATFDTWCAFDPAKKLQRPFLRLLQPEVFFDFEPLLIALNDALVAYGIVPDLAQAYRRAIATQHQFVSQDCEASLHKKIQRWIYQSDEAHAQTATHDTAPRVRSSKSASASASAASSNMQGPEISLQSFLIEQQRINNLSSATSLRDVARAAPNGMFASSDQNTIELLARVFDFIFASGQIPGEIKNLLGQLQLPLLRTALLDKEFFHSQSHPARRLLDQLAQSSIGAPTPVNADDPLYKIIEHIVDRVQHEFDQQIRMFSDVVADMTGNLGSGARSELAAELTADLTSYIADQQRDAEEAVRPHIDEALQEEKMREAEIAAANDIAARTDTGEVAGFVERFLESQWLRVLTLTHSVADRKPKALANARKAMDELIWSVKPKTSADDRAALITKLPAMLALINAWLNVIKWHEPARVTFFSRLVERHAAIVQHVIELSPRHQLHLAVNVAQKASERRLIRRARELEVQPADQFANLVDTLTAGSWIEFTRVDDAAAKAAAQAPTAFRLVWVSPLRGRFIFCNRQGDEPFSMTSTELAAALREQGANLIPNESLSTRALLAALQDMDYSD